MPNDKNRGVIMASEHLRCPVNSVTDIGEREEELLARRNHFDVIHDVKSEVKEEPVEIKWLIENGVGDKSRQEEVENGKFNEPISSNYSGENKKFDTKGPGNIFAAGDQGIDQIKNEIKVENDYEDYFQCTDDLFKNNAELKMQTLKTEDEIDIVYEDIKPEMYRVKLSGNKSHLNTIANIVPHEPSDSEAGHQQNTAEEEHETFVQMDNYTRSEHSPTDWKNRQRINSKKKHDDCKYSLKKKSDECKQELHERTPSDKIPYQCKLHPESFIFRRRMKKYECKFCSKSFIKKNILLVHERIHKGEKPFTCNVCVKSFVQRINLLEHERVHTGEKPFHCYFCSKSYSRSSALKRHERTHSGEKPFLCNLCSKSFTQSTALKFHERIHTGEKPFQCKICLKLFTRKDTFERHVKTHTGEKPFQCNLCSKSFIQSTALKFHEKTHTGEKPFQCKVCLKSFTLSSSLRVHERIHTGEKPFQCNLCSKSFSQSASLRAHERIHRRK